MALPFLQEKYELLGWGGLGLVFKISDHIVLKYTATTDEPLFENEVRIFDHLERHHPSPHIVYSFFSLPNLNFMQHITGGNLEMRLRTQQRRDPKTEQVLEDEIEAEHLILRWMKELTNAAAWLEALGLAHGDMRPANLLLDEKDHIKVADFDNTQPIGTEVDVGTAPYARVLGDEAGPSRGTFGFLGARTEQFAIGSVFYYMTRGYEPYDDQWYGKDHGPVTVDMMQRMEFPHTTITEEKDSIIHKCWYGEFHTMEDLSNTARLIGSQDEDTAQALTPDFILARREDCKQIMADWPTTPLMLEQTIHNSRAISPMKSIVFI